MTIRPDPKPEPREPKRRARLHGSKSERAVPVERQRSPRCLFGTGRCGSIVEASGLCHYHLFKDLDMRARYHVFARDGGRCQDSTPHECEGRLEWCHTETRISLATRWTLEGAVVLCSRRHQFYTRREADWFEWCMTRFTTKRWLAIRQFAREGHVPWKPQDYTWVLEQLTLSPITIAMMQKANVPVLRKVA